MPLMRAAQALSCSTESKRPTLRAHPSRHHRPARVAEANRPPSGRLPPPNRILPHPPFSLGNSVPPHRSRPPLPREKERRPKPRARAELIHHQPARPPGHAHRNHLSGSHPERRCGPTPTSAAACRRSTVRANRTFSEIVAIPRPRLRQSPKSRHLSPGEPPHAPLLNTPSPPAVKRGGSRVGGAAPVVSNCGDPRGRSPRATNAP